MESINYNPCTFLLAEILNFQGSAYLLVWEVLVDNQISKDTDLYKLYNTNIHEKIAEQKKRANEKVKSL